MTKAEAVRQLVDELMNSPLSEDELVGVVDLSMDLIIYGAAGARAGGALQLRMCAEIAKRRDAAAFGRQPHVSTEPIYAAVVEANRRAQREVAVSLGIKLKSDPAMPSTEPAVVEPTAADLSSEALSILDEMRDGFAYNMSTDSRIAEVERWDARLRGILFVLGKVP
jgi:hypothetical protein